MCSFVLGVFCLRFGQDLLSLNIREGDKDGSCVLGIPRGCWHSSALLIAFDGPEKRRPGPITGHQGREEPGSWLWLKNPVPKWNPGKWKHGPTPA